MSTRHWINYRPVYPVAGKAKPWGTAHALLMADGVANEPLAVINTG